MSARVLLVVALGGLAGLAPPAGSEEIGWLTDLDEAREKAASTGRPMLAVFR